MRVVAILATYNEERFIGRCLDHLIGQGVEVYLIDNDSTDATVEIAREYLGVGLIGIERFPRRGYYSWRPLLERKQELAGEIRADWYVHVDADEIRLPPPSHDTLVSALKAVEAEGFNAVNFIEYTFVPTLEHPDHDHPDYQRTMSHYYPFIPRLPHRLNAWKGQDDEVDLASKAGHEVVFPGLRMYPESFPMRHYLFLSLDHAMEKYLGRAYDPAELVSGWHGQRARIGPDDIRLLSEKELRPYVGDHALDATRPFTRHPSLSKGQADAQR